MAGDAFFIKNGLNLGVIVDSFAGGARDKYTCRQQETSRIFLFFPIVMDAIDFQMG
jgi:hypothetical protein